MNQQGTSTHKGYQKGGECGKIASPTLSAAIGRASDPCRAAVAMQDPKGKAIGRLVRRSTARRPCIARLGWPAH